MPSNNLTLNLTEGSVSFSFSPAAARELKESMNELMNRLKTVAAKTVPGGGKPVPQKPMEYRHKGKDVFVEVFCNPNIWASPFAAKVLLTIRDSNVRLSTEAELTRVLEDLNQYLEQVGD